MRYTYLYQVIKNNKSYSKHCSSEAQVKKLVYNYLKKNHLTLSDFYKDFGGYYCEDKDIYIMPLRYEYRDEVKCNCVRIEL